MAAAQLQKTKRQLAEDGIPFGYDGCLFPYKFCKQEKSGWFITKYDQQQFGVKSMGHKGFIANGDIAGKFVEVTIEWSELHFKPNK